MRFLSLQNISRFCLFYVSFVPIKQLLKSFKLVLGTFCGATGAALTPTLLMFFKYD
jgi:hypothetical protein